MFNKIQNCEQLKSWYILKKLSLITNTESYFAFADQGAILVVWRYNLQELAVSVSCNVTECDVKYFVSMNGILQCIYKSVLDKLLQSKSFLHTNDYVNKKQTPMRAHQWFRALPQTGSLVISLY